MPRPTSQRRLGTLFVGVVCLALATPALWSQSEKVTVLDEIVAKVNSEIITLTDLNKELTQLRNSISQEQKDPKQQQEEFEKRKQLLLKEMIDSKIMIQKAEELGMTANIDVDVAANMEAWRKQIGVPNMEVLDQALRQAGSSLAERREMMKRQMIINGLLEQFVYGKLTLLTSEIEAFYKEHLNEFTEPAEIELAEILYLTEGKDKTQVRRRAEETLARLKGGSSFEDEARKHSEGPTASKGGNIGTFKEGSMAPALEAVAFKLKTGEVSGIVETDYGFQIVKLINRKENQVKSLDEVRPYIQRLLYMRKAEPEYKEFVEDLRSQSYIYIAPSYREQYDVEGL